MHSVLCINDDYKDMYIIEGFHICIYETIMNTWLSHAPQNVYLLTEGAHQSAFIRVA